MVSKVYIKRTSTDNSPPSGLLPGELAVEMGTPTRLWVGVPTTIDAAAKKLLVDTSLVGAGVFVGDLPKVAPLQGDLWFESDTGAFWIWYDDGTGAQWVQVNGVGFASGGSGDKFPAGTALIFQQSDAPTGWTKQTTHNDKALRIVSGTASDGGTVAFSAAFARTATDAFTLDNNSLVSHSHREMASNNTSTTQGYEVKGSDNSSGPGQASIYTQPTGASGPHSHGIDLRVQYVDCIVATKD